MILFKNGYKSRRAEIVFATRGSLHLLQFKIDKETKFQKCAPHLKCPKTSPLINLTKNLHQHYDISNVFGRIFCTEITFFFLIVQRRVVPSNAYMCLLYTTHFIVYC
jgi:hypothetical protein